MNEPFIPQHQLDNIKTSETFRFVLFQNNNDNGDCDGDNIFDGDGTWG